ncbi:MAG: aminotransferase class V-fold PLP-dependent enzyme [Phycisphaerales bacterium JB050]
MPEAPPSYSPLSAHWSRLDQHATFLNHGSFGACPDAVLSHQSELRDTLERDPVRFMVEQLEPLHTEAIHRLAAFLGVADHADLVFVPNATHGVNAVLRSLEFEPGDEILVCDHEYNACVNAAKFVADRTRACLKMVRLPWPVVSEDQLVESLLAGVTERTSLVLLSHITSPTAIVLPIERIQAALRERAVPLLIDGAHAPGMIPLDLAALDPDYYTGNCHKWMCAPKGAGFLYVRRDLQHQIHPAVISHGFNARRTDRSRFELEFGWTGTGDPTPMLCVPAAIDAMRAIISEAEGPLPTEREAWRAIMQRNRALVLEGRAILAEALGITPPVPEAMIGSIATLDLPARAQPPAPGSTRYHDPLQNELIDNYGVQVPIVPWPDRGVLVSGGLDAPSTFGRAIRISAQLYNDRSQYEHLARALVQVVPREHRA